MGLYDRDYMKAPEPPRGPDVGFWLTLLVLAALLAWAFLRLREHRSLRSLLPHKIVHHRRAPG